MQSKDACRYTFLLSIAAACLLGIPAQAQQSSAPQIRDIFVTADTDDFDPGLPIGDDFPAIHALYEGGEISSVDQFMGDNGLAFFAVRSVDWCPFCRSQMAELQRHVSAFELAGIGIVAITYDSPELQQVFIDAASLTYPFVSDIRAESMTALGILNEEYSPGDSAYGIPHPGVFVIDPDGVIAGKIFIDSFRERTDGASTLEYAMRVLGTGE